MVHVVDIHVGQRIRHRRQVMGATQLQLARMVGVRFQQIQKYETGENRVSVSRLWLIAAAQKTSMNFYFKGLSQHPGRCSSGIGASNEEIMQLVRYFRSIPDAQRYKLLDLIRAIHSTVKSSYQSHSLLHLYEKSHP